MRRFSILKENRRHACLAYFSVVYPLFVYRSLLAVTPAVCIELRIADIEVLRIEFFLKQAECLAEPLEVYNFPLAQETDRIADFGIFDHAENIIVGSAGFLLRRHILEEIGDQIAFALELAGIERNTACRLGPDADRVVHIVSLEAAVFDLFHGEIFGELVYDGGYHLQMSQFFCADVGIEIAHLKSIVNWAHHQNS